MGTFVYDETSLASLTGFIGEGGAKEAGANNQIIVFLIHLSHTMSLCFISQKAEGRKNETSHRSQIYGVACDESQRSLPTGKSKLNKI